MVKDLLNSMKESAQSVLPISLIVFILHLTLTPMPAWTFVSFLLGTVLLILGMSIFSLGADNSMMPIGEAIGSELTKSRKLWLMVLAGFVIGVLVTIAEPDLQVLTKQVPAVPDTVMVASVAIGVGFFLVLGLVRILLQFSLAKTFVVSYILVFLVAAFIAPDYLGVGIDAGGVTTGPITVPFILALGAGVSAVRGGKSAEEDSFGLCGLSSIGPIMAVLVMGMFFDPSTTGFAFEPPNDIAGFGALLAAYWDGTKQFFMEVLIVLLPIVVMFMLFQFVRLKMSRIKLVRILVGILYTLVGLTIFLVGVNIGFMPAGTFIGSELASLSYNWILLPLSLVLGLFVVNAEPAVHVLTKQVEDITNGAISRKLMMAGLSIGVSAALILSVIRILTGASYWFFVLPAYIVALTLTFLSPKLFTAIAFDSGGVAAGTMTAAFLLPFAIGISDAVGGNAMTDAFGIIGMVATFPIITIQAVGVLYQLKLKRSTSLESELDLAFVGQDGVPDDSAAGDPVEQFAAKEE